MECCAKGQGAEANKRLGYIVGSAARLLEGTLDKEATQQWLTLAFHAFLDTEAGKTLTEKTKTSACYGLQVRDTGTAHREGLG
ncbi:hypothetical protein Xtri_06455 [Xanthomonas campestris pv. trichodesmae]|uniref:Uncharacterized protein n=1 Tax=Xanthomonas citri pv. sesbaniae TaxID=473425 RepID=A0AAW4RLC1_XANCI|nr:hypothetical protein [Xanthomonas campestris pv. trichodesmae]MBZ3924315.1 hypothetical protein [Xanthomonas citri pv. sesbaniae]